MVKCAHCKEPFEPTGTGQQRSWCKPCRNDYMRAYKAKNPPRPKAATPKQCVDCDTTFTRWEGWKHPGSAGARCKPCYLAYCRKRAPKNPNPKRRRTAEEVERPQGKRWQELRAKVLAEETHCGICGEYVDQTLDRHDRHSATVDHIHPLTLGGDYWDRANLRLAHRTCNSAEPVKQARQRIAELEAENQRLRTQLANMQVRGSIYLGDTPAEEPVSRDLDRALNHSGLA
jgi:5-methylcytosine-specific restriction endonuclease McrA